MKAQFKYTPKIRAGRWETGRPIKVPNYETKARRLHTSLMISAWRLDQWYRVKHTHGQCEITDGSEL